MKQQNLAVDVDSLIGQQISRADIYPASTSACTLEVVFMSADARANLCFFSVLLYFLNLITVYIT